MKIDIWSDFACPFCYIGKRRLEQALAEFPQRDAVEITFHSFELDPNAPTDQTESIHEALAKKYGMSVAEAMRMNEGVAEQAASVGLSFQFDKIVLTNTFDAHRLTQFAKTKGKDTALTEKLFYAYFTAGRHISDVDTLVEIAEEVGLEREEVIKVLQDKDSFSENVRKDEVTAQQIGVRGVPFFVINQKYAVSGAQPKETFVRALEKIWAEEKNQPVLQEIADADTDASCVDGSCAVPNKKQDD